MPRSAMPRSAPRRGRPAHRRPAGWGWRIALAALVLGAVAVGTGVLVPRLEGQPAAGRLPQAVLTQPSGPPATSPDVRAAGTTSAPPTPTPTPPLLREPGAVPAKGTGDFDIAAGTGEVFGRAGGLRRYRVAVERGSGADADAFAAAVDLALGDPGSWTASGRLRLQRVPAGAAHDFTVYLATPDTAGRMCAAGGVNIRINGRPYTSCRATGKVIINLERWRRSVDHFVAARVPLSTYRLYVVNHEVGHELGQGHERCPGRGQPAPAMMQQTLFLNGCVANAWPYLNGKRYAGKPV